MTFLLRPFASRRSCCQLLVCCRNCVLRNGHIVSSVAVPVSHDNAGDRRTINQLDAHFCQLVPVTKRRVSTLHYSPNIQPSARSISSSTKTGLRWLVVNLKSAVTRGYSRLRPNVPWLTLSPKAIVEASPLYIQPYLRLIRLHRPIGICLEIAVSYVCYLLQGG